MKDSEIIELYFARSEDAITETNKKHGSFCRSVTFGILGSREDSEECVSDTYMNVWNAIPPKRPDRLGAFVVRICRNIALNLFKARNTLKSGGGYGSVVFDEISECLPAPDSVESTAEANAVLKAVEAFVRSLSREKQQIFMHRYYYFRSCAGIADDLHISEAKVKMTLKRTREKLREYLEKEGIDV